MMNMLLFYKNKVVRGETITNVYQDYNKGKLNFIINGKFVEIPLNQLDKVMIDGIVIYTSPELKEEEDKNSVNPDVFPF